MNYEQLRGELREYYWHVADDRAEKFCDFCLGKLDAMYHEHMTVFEMKRMQYRVITENMDVVLFYNSPFYYETGTLAGACDGARDFRGHRNAAGWTYWKNEHLFVDQNPELYQLMRRQKKEKMYLIWKTRPDGMEKRQMMPNTSRRWKTLRK